EHDAEHRSVDRRSQRHAAPRRGRRRERGLCVLLIEAGHLDAELGRRKVLLARFPLELGGVEAGLPGDTPIPTTRRRCLWPFRVAERIASGVSLLASAKASLIVISSSRSGRRPAWRYTPLRIARSRAGTLITRSVTRSSTPGTSALTSATTLARTSATP